MPVSDQIILKHVAAHPGVGREAIRKEVAPDVSETTMLAYNLKGFMNVIRFKLKPGDLANIK